MLLIVDDDQAIREALKELLEDEGYEVETAADGVEAIDAMVRHTPCVLLLDLMMPHMTGWQVVDAMKADAVLSRVPVCVMTAVPDKAPKSAVCVLKKPLAVPRLLEVIRHHC